MKTYLVFAIQAFQQKSEDGRLLDIVGIELIDTNEKNALKRAKAFVKRDFYRVSAIIEKTI